MKKKIYCISLLLLYGLLFGAENKKIIQDTYGSYIQAVFNNNGIIESIDGTVGKILATPMKIKIENNDTVYLELEYSIYQDCYDIVIKKNGFKIDYTIINFKTKERRKNTIVLDSPNALMMDDLIQIKNENKTIKSFYNNDATYSLLPLIRYENNVLIQYYGGTIPLDDPGSRKYEYSPDKKNIICSHIMPGDIFEKFMSVSIFDIKSKDITVNLVNYLILYCYNDMIGTMLLPILFDLDDNLISCLETEITADSYLTEGNVKYLPVRLKDTAIGTPWCEGLKGDGIGSKITLKAKNDISTLIISNGFDSLKKYIYYNNNRVKQIRITDLNNKKKFILAELPDTVEPFEINLPFSSKQLEIEILSVYKGKKYEDTCLNYILAK